jgi:hypothetical protein
MPGAGVGDHGMFLFLLNYTSNAAGDDARAYCRGVGDARYYSACYRRGPRAVLYGFKVVDLVESFKTDWTPAAVVHGGSKRYSTTPCGGRSLPPSPTTLDV